MQWDRYFFEAGLDWDLEKSPWPSAFYDHYQLFLSYSTSVVLEASFRSMPLGNCINL